MNEILKQRVVGAIVITALAAIFIPMLFDDPVADTDSYTNELSLPQQPLDNTQTLLNSIPESSQEILTQPQVAEIELQAQEIKESVQQTKLESWIIQVGSFSQEKNALEFRDNLRKNEFTAYVDSVDSNQGTLYRLRVGPELSEKLALKTQQRLEALYKVKTFLVTE